MKMHQTFVKFVDPLRCVGASQNLVPFMMNRFASGCWPHDKLPDSPAKRLRLSRHHVGRIGGALDREDLRMGKLVGCQTYSEPLFLGGSQINHGPSKWLCPRKAAASEGHHNRNSAMDSSRQRRLSSTKFIPELHSRNCNLATHSNLAGQFDGVPNSEPGSALSAQFPIIAKQYSFVRKKAGERVSRRRSRRIREQNKEQRGSGGGGRRTGPAARNMPEMGSLAQASPPESGGGRGNCK